MSDWVGGSIQRVSTSLISLFLALGSVYFALAVADRATGILGGFSSLLEIIFLAWLLSFLVAQAAGGLAQRLGIGRGKSIAIVYVLVVVLVILTIAAIVQIGAHDAAAILSRSNEITTRIHGLLVVIQGSVGLSLGTVDLAATFDAAQRSAVDAIGTSLDAQAQAIAAAAAVAAGDLFIIVVLSLYAVTDADVILRALNRLVPNRYSADLDLVEQSVGRAFGGFLKTQVILVAVQVMLTLVVGVVFGLPYMFLTCVVVALAMAIPFFGPPLALLPPLLVAIAFRPETAIPVVLVLFVVQTALVSLIQPRLMKESAGLHPILVLLALLLGAQVAGLWGALFGNPFVAVVTLLVRYLVNLQAVAEVPESNLDDAVAEVQASDPGIPLDEAVAIAADQAEAVLEDQAEASAADGAAADGTTPDHAV